MTSPHAHQALISTPFGLVTASNTTLNLLQSSSSSSVATSATPHTGMIRLFAFHEPNFLLSTGEDKLLIASTLPGMETVSKRELVKRANALVVTREGEVIVGDKFGDVFKYPLHPPPVDPSAPAPTAAEKEKLKPVPILGHVSMLTSLVHVPDLDGKQFVITGDRDEHVRVSHYPRGDTIEGFLWGAKKFISFLLLLKSNHHHLLVGSGDPFLRLYSLALPISSSKLLASLEVQHILLPHIVVTPELPPAVFKERKGGRRGGAKAQGKGKGKDADGEAEDGIKDEMNGEFEEVEAKGPVVKPAPPPGLAIVKLEEWDGKGVIVLAAGSQALLFIPSSALSPASPNPAPPSAHSLLTFPHPILDFSLSSSSMNKEIYVSLDLARGIGGSEEDTAPIVRVGLSENGELVRLERREEIEDKLKRLCSSVPTASLPNVSSLYPSLSFLLEHVSDEWATANAGDEGGGKGKKRPLQEETVGRQEKGRLEMKRKLEEAKKV
ncbi:hypothetical protein T439DRAFT_321406 [Meredithblackwellia eburnea MCA 4105]